METPKNEKTVLLKKAVMRASAELTGKTPLLIKVSEGFFDIKTSPEI